jgi:hypothetical protein
MFLLFPATNFRPLFWTMQVRHEDFSFCNKIGSSTAATTAFFFKECDALLQPLFDFALAEALSANIHELLEATYVYSAATKSPICSTLLSAMLRFEQYAVLSSNISLSRKAFSILPSLPAKLLLQLLHDNLHLPTFWMH